MTLRALVAALVLANAMFLAWSAGWIDPVPGGGAEREPARLARQVRPETLRVLPAVGASAAQRGSTPGAAASSASIAAAPPPPAASASASAATAPLPAPSTVDAACLESPPLPPEQAAAAESLLTDALPAGSWERRPAPPAWLVYMGPFAREETLARKGAELRRIGVTFEPVAGPPQLVPGLELGRFDSRPAAQAGLAAIVGRGVRTARVVALPDPPERLRIASADAALRARLASISAPVLGAPLGASFRACAPDAAAAGPR